MNNSYEKEILEVFVDDIIPNRFQPRLTFDEKSLEDLAISIKEHGIIQPLVVRKIADKYEIIAGERRYKAAQMAGLKKVPAIVMDLDDKESAEVAVIENTQRRDLSSLEEAESYKKLLDKGYLTQEQLANRMGKNQATISNKLRLLNLPFEVKKALLENQISERHARSLLSLNNEAEQIKFLNDIVNNKLTVKQTDDKIKEQLNASSFSNNNSELPPFNFNSSFTASEPVQENPIPEVNSFSNNNTELPPFNFNSSFTASEPVQENPIPEVNTFSNNNTELPPFNFNSSFTASEPVQENPIPEVNSFSNNNTELPPFNFNSSFTASEPVQENPIPEVNTFSNNNTELPPFNFNSSFTAPEPVQENPIPEVNTFSNNNTELPPFNFNSSFTASEPVQENPIPEVNTFSNNNTELPPFNFNSSFTAPEPVQENPIPEVNSFSNNNTELPPFNFSPDVPIVEQAKEVKPFMEETNGIDFIKPEPIVNYDINQIINNSTDINPIEETKNIDDIIGIKTSEEISKPEEKVSKNKFLIDFEEIPKEEMADQPKTYTDELVQEYRQQTAVGEVKTAASTNELDLDGAIKSVRETINGLKNSNIEVETEEFDFESLYQIIIKINKKKN